MASNRCPVCGETVLPGWDHCPACQHPYPDDEADNDEDEEEEDDEDDDEA
jgi:hypothetical protein